MKSIAWLYYLGSIFCVLAAIGVTVAIFSNESDNNAETLGRAIGILVVLIGSVALAVPGAGWLRKLDRRGRIPVGILSGFGLINFPVGTLVNAYILYLVFSAKGKQVLSDEYKEVIRLTPHIKYTTPLWLKIAAGVLLAAAALAIGLAFMPK
ncbi:MAG TPA: hypothetical protein VHZ24_18035 [Pirellulales bacterium]|nr:hypothetical protein [Pirellulales bacterium]